MARSSLIIAALAATCSLTAAARTTPAEPGPEPQTGDGLSPLTRKVLGAGLPRPDADDLRRWPEGPVRYLLSGPETRLFKGLKTDTERRAFIKQFWLRRDPDIASLENEFRFDFWRRVAEANQLFTHSTVPGWRTDRGRYYITLGPPDELEATRMPNQRSGVTVVVPTQSGGRTARRFGADSPSQAFHGLERWTYRTRPGSRLPPNFVLAFRLGPDGDYELSRDPRDFALFEGMLSEVMRPVITTEEVGVITDPDPESDLTQLYQDVAIALDLGTLETVPEPEDLLGELVTSEEFFGRIPFLLQSDYYKTTSSSTLAVFTIGVQRRALGPGPSGQEIMAMGKLESVEDPAQVVMLTGEDALEGAPGNEGNGELMLFQVVKAVPPGSYNAHFGIMDEKENVIGSYRERVSIPAFPGEGLMLSTLALARQLEPLGREDREGSPAEPFRLGNYRVVPRTESQLRNGDEFALYYQVYGATPGRDGRLRLRVTYRFFLLRDGEFRPIGAPIVLDDRDQSVQGWSFPMQDWPAATFRLEVTVEDEVSGDVAVGQTVFGVTAGPEPS